MKSGFFRRLIVLCSFPMMMLLNIVSAQAPVFNLTAGKDQLSGGNVTRLLQDSKGFIWIGTTKGLFVFDGFGYREMAFHGKQQLSEVTALAFDNAGMVWVGFSNGAIASGHENGFTFFNPQEGTPQVRITSILFEPDNTLWISTYGEGVYFYRDGRLFNINTDDGLADNYVYSLVRNKDGTIWAGNDAGISVCRSGNGEKVLRHYSTADGLPDIIVQTIVPARKGGFWIGMQEKGICFFDLNAKKFNNPLPEPWAFGSVNDILDFGDLLWVATDGFGLIEISLSANRTVKAIRQFEPAGKRVNRIIHDREGSVWLAASGGSLYWSSGPAIRHYKSVDNISLGNIHTIHADDDGTIWFANDNGLNFFNPAGENEKLSSFSLPAHRKGTQGITSLYHDPGGNMWIGTFGNGLFRMAENSKTPLKIQDDNNLLNNNILGISGKGSEVWFATLGGAASCNLNESPDGKFHFKHFSSESGPGNNFIYTVMVDRKGRTWFGTDGKGPAVYEYSHFRRFGTKDGMNSKVIYSITSDADGNIWFGSSNEGVYRFDGSIFTNFSLTSGLSNLKITSVISAAKTQIIVVHTLGVDIINARTGQVSYLSSKSGISDINPDLNAVSADKAGTLWIGTRDGLIHYTPGYMQAMAVPVTNIRRVSVYLSDEAARQGEVFAHDRNHLSFEYIGLWYNNPERVNYRVKLEGNDPDWIQTVNRITTYSNLRPGKYTFRVQSSVNNDFSFAGEAKFTFTISSPIYTRWWFILVMGLVVLAIIYFIVKTRMSRIKREQQLLKEKAESQFQMLKSQVNPHFLFNNFSTLMAIIEEDKDLAIEYVGKLSAFFRYILEYRDTDLISLTEELEIAENYIFLQKKRYGENLSVIRDIRNEHLNSLIPPLTLQLILENAVKHNIVSAAKQLKISIYSSTEFLIIENSLQLRKTSEISTGMGLQNIRSRYRIFTSREITVSQTDTQFIVSLPLIFSNKKNL